MPKITTKFVCQSCGYETPRWLGKCPDCGGFSTFSEEKVAPVARAGLGGASAARAVASAVGAARPQTLGSVRAQKFERLSTGISELDRVLGGGVVPGALMLIGGDPGIGKSTLLIEAAVRLAAEYGSGLYLSGEESVSQISMRAERLGLQSEALLLAAETDLLSIEGHIREQKPAFVVIDSIQTVAHPALDSAPGTLTQVREGATLFQKLAKELDVAIFLVGHVNKEGNLAGPRALEHIVDTVLQLEGDEHGQYRLLRAAKNRFGSTNELGVFEMTEVGMISVENPSQLFLAQRQSSAPGSIVVATIEGARPLLVEVQALCAPSYFTSPRRTVTGADFNRVAVVLAVIEKRLGLRLGDMDVYINVVGGVRVTEPALDLGIALAVVSSLRDMPCPPAACVFGEIGLAGEVRAVTHGERRAQEAARLGFSRCVVPQSGAGKLKGLNAEISGITSVREAVELLLPAALSEGGKRGPRGAKNDSKSAKYGARNNKNSAESPENTSDLSNDLPGHWVERAPRYVQSAAPDADDDFFDEEINDT